jgi:hypothetical protein
LAVATVAAVIAMAIGMAGAVNPALSGTHTFRPGRVHRIYARAGGGAVLTVVFYRAASWVSPECGCCYMAAVLAGGSASVRVAPIMGSVSCLGTVALFLPGNDVLLPVGLGPDGF